MVRGRYTSLTLLAVVLLVACGGPIPPETGQVADATRPAATHTPYPTYTPYPTHTPYPTPTPLPTAAPTEMAAPAVPPAETPEPAQSPVLGPAQSPVVATTLALERIPDTDPTPPLTIVVDDLRIEADGTYRMTGRVRNDGSEIYEGVGVHASFLEENGNGHGPVDVYVPCPYLEPGGECPFSLGIYSRDYVAYHVHPFGQPVTGHQPAPVTLGGLAVTDDGIGNVRITGTATNENPFAVRDPTIGGALVDGDGRVVSVGSTLVLGTVAPGAGVSFDLRVAYVPHATYVLYAQATQE